MKLSFLYTWSEIGKNQILHGHDQLFLQRFVNVITYDESFLDTEISTLDQDKFEIQLK